MNDRDQNIALAEFHGWEGVPVKNVTKERDGVIYWRSQTPDGLEKYSSSFESSCAIRWLKKPDGSPFLIRSGPITLNNVDTYSNVIALEYSKANGYGKAPPDVKPSLAYFLEYLPNYGADLNVMHDVEKLIPLKDLINYLDILSDLTKYNSSFATALERREALLRTIRKWK